MWECEPGDHLDVELIVLIQGREVASINKTLYSVTRHANAVVEVTEPNDGLKESKHCKFNPLQGATYIVVVYAPIPLKPQAMMNRLSQC
jgi:hypothetical protein